MGACGDQCQATLPGTPAHLLQLAAEIHLDLSDIRAYIGIDLDGGLQQLFLEPIDLAKRADDLGGRGSQRPGLPVDQLKFHLNTKGWAWVAIEFELHRNAVYGNRETLE